MNMPLYERKNFISGAYSRITGILLLMAALFAIGCVTTISQVDKNLNRLDLAIGKHDLKTAGQLAKDIDHGMLSEHQRCLLKLYTVRYFRLSGQPDNVLKTLRQIRRHCGNNRKVSAWSLFELGLYAENRPPMAIRVFKQVLRVYPDSGAAHPALFEMLSVAKKAGIDPAGYLKRTYILHPKAEMAAEILFSLAGLFKGKGKNAVLMRLATQFPNHPLGAKARLILVKQIESRDPQGALEVLYKLAFGTERSLLIGSYATGVEGPALLEAARVWDRYMNNPVRAERDYRRFIRIYPASSKCDDALFEVYLMYRRRGHPNKAMSILKELARRFPDRARGMQALYMLKTGEK